MLIILVSKMYIGLRYETSFVKNENARGAAAGTREAMRIVSAQGVLFGQSVADVAGISSSDLECIDFLNLEGRVTAGGSPTSRA